MNKPEKILVIDDEKDICDLLADFLSAQGFQVSSVFSGLGALILLEKEKFDLIICDFRLGDIDGLEILLRIRDMDARVPVIIITGYSDIRMAVKVIKHGAFDYVTKPLYPDEILLTIKNALQEAAPGRQSGNNIPDEKRKIIGESPEMQEVFGQVEMVAVTDYRVMLLGENGTGKESIAQEIHSRSKRHREPFVALDCGAIPKELAASELFGHEKGAFTGTVNARAGQFELASGGTLFLDEISNLSPDIQVFLLRSLQERRIRRIGDSKDIAVDVRIIAASNENLAVLVKEGRFREDLYHRLNEFSILIPPLRERKKDIILLAEYFLREASAELHKSVQFINGEATDILLAYAWPGNVRELKNVIRRAALIASQHTIEASMLPPELVREAAFESTRKERSSTDAPDLKSSAHEAEAAVILQTLKKVNYNRTKAAQMLNIDRKTLYNKMKLMNIR